ncbi:MAG: AprI/Inh family metalloprotease inhibitor [Beijerinckiaceae bacterium]
MAQALTRTRIAAGLLLSAASASAQTPPVLLPRSAPAVEALAGAWDIVSADGARRCRLQLNRLEHPSTVSQATGGARTDETGWMLMGMPTACRTTFPALATRNAWALGKDGVLHLAAGGGVDAIPFKKSAGGAFTASADMRLEPVGRSIHGEERVQKVAAATATLSRTENAVDPQRASLAGAYRLTRDSAGHACALQLTLTPTRIWGAEGDVLLAHLTGECADEGLRIFSPAGWRMAEGRLFLVAKKGHSIGFSRDGNGRWYRDPPAGRPLLLTRE